MSRISSEIPKKPSNNQGPAAQLKSCLSEHSAGETRNTKPLRKSVSFHQVHIREYERIVGDNPSVTAGPAVSMAWNHHEHTSLTVSDYESTRPPRRTHPQIQMPANVRRQHLENSGASWKEIQDAQTEIRRVQKNRQASAAMQEFESTQIILESIGRKWKRRFSKKTKEQEVLRKSTDQEKTETRIDDTSTDVTDIEELEC